MPSGIDVVTNNSQPLKAGAFNEKTPGKSIVVNRRVASNKKMYKRHCTINSVSAIPISFRS
jgi:hypothetical protein